MIDLGGLMSGAWEIASLELGGLLAVRTGVQLPWPMSINRSEPTEERLVLGTILQDFDPILLLARSLAGGNHKSLASLGDRYYGPGMIWIDVFRSGG
ncbi:MAG: hypothetical protein WD178_07915 [Actinomycetota bacterium]